MNTITTTTVHNACQVRVANAGLLGWCEDHRVRVYRDGIDWHTDQDNELGVLVLHVHRGRLSDRVTVTTAPAVTDLELAQLAGYGPRNFGYDVTRYDDGTAVVSLWND